VKVREKIWVGIDVGKAHHHACAVDETGKVVFSKRLGNGQAEIEALIARAGKAAGHVRWALDMTSGSAGLLLAVLRQTGAQVLYVPGRLVNRMAGAFAGEGKSDAKDAFTIAETARLASIFPALEAAFDYSTRSALVLLTGFQTPSGLREAGADAIAEYLRTGGAWPKGIPAMVDKALAAAAAQTIALPTEAAVAPLIARLAAQLLDLDRELKDLDKQITGTFGQHPHAARITSVNGFGPILGAQLLADTGGDLQTAFGSSARLAAYAGLAPVPRDSGRVRGNLHRPKRYHRGLRRVFYLAALSAIKPDGPSRVFYQRKRAEGKLHTQALIALARRLIDVIWALLRDGREFHPSPPITASAA
jgi:transposase